MHGWSAPAHASGEGWWPVLSIELEDGWLEAIGYDTPFGRELVVCFYQLQGGRIVGWWISREEALQLAV